MIEELYWWVHSHRREIKEALYGTVEWVSLAVFFAALLYW
jgi:hypothetical protein